MSAGSCRISRRFKPLMVRLLDSLAIITSASSDNHCLLQGRTASFVHSHLGEDNCLAGGDSPVTDYVEGIAQISFLQPMLQEGISHHLWSAKFPAVEIVFQEPACRNRLTNFQLGRKAANKHTHCAKFRRILKLMEIRCV